MPEMTHLQRLKGQLRIMANRGEIGWQQCLRARYALKSFSEEELAAITSIERKANGTLWISWAKMNGNCCRLIVRAYCVSCAWFFGDDAEMIHGLPDCPISDVISPLRRAIQNHILNPSHA
jgi:hypothetical protein